MALKTALIISGDASGAKTAVDEVRKGVEALGAGARGAAAPMQQLQQAQAAAATSARSASSAARDEAAAVAQAERAMEEAIRAGRQLATTQGALANSGVLVTRSAGQVRAGYAQLGQQMQDIGIQLSMGTDLMRVMAMQGGQLATSIDMLGLKGVGGAVARFFAGPWGAAFLTGAAVLAPFVDDLLDSGEAADTAADRYAEAAKAADSFGKAQSLIGEVIDLATGKLKIHNAVLLETVRLQAAAGIAQARQDQIKAREELETLGSPTFLERAGASLAGVSPTAGFGGGAASGALVAELRRDYAPLQSIVQQYRDGRIGISEARREIEALGKAGRLAGKDVNDVVLAFTKLGTARNDEIAFQQALDALDGKGVAPELRPYDSPDKPKKPPKAQPPAARDGFGLDAASRIRAITEAFDGTPPVIRQINSAVAQLDALIEDLAEKKPPNFAALIEQAREAKTAVQEGLTRPLDEYLDAQQEALDIGALILEGREDEAAALRVIQQLQKQMGPLTAAQKAGVEGVVASLRAQEKQIERNHQQKQKYLATISDIRSIVAETFYDGPRSLAKLPERLLDSFRVLKAEELTDSLFGDLFDALEDAATGVTPIQRAAEKMGDAVDYASSKIRQLGNAAAGATGGGHTLGGEPITSELFDLLKRGNGVAGPDGDIVVTGQKLWLGGKGLDSEKLFGDAIGGLITKSAAKLGGLLGIPDADLKIKELGKQIGVKAGDALGGAFEGQAASGFASMLGIKQSSTGGAIGGAIGSFIPGIGGAIGGLIGGTLGGLFGKKQVDYGSAVVTSATGDASTKGSSASLRSGAGGLAEQVQDGVRAIAEQLGGALGGFDLVIGTYDGKYRVRTTAGGGWNGQGGLNFGGKSANYLHDFGEDQAAAISFAIADAIKDGAVKGLSAAVEKALRSSDDAQEALAEALRVQEVELLLGGLGAEMEKAFRAFDAQAKERVRIARDYGLDVVAIERRNAEERTRLAEQLLSAQVGSLQQLITEMTSGSLFEGSALDRITALNAEIAKAKADLDAGVEGAGDKLANLYAQRLEASKAAYGTTGGYASDRSATIDEARAAIARANARIAEAQAKTSDPALQQTNAALDENNDQNARIIAALEASNALLARIAAGGATTGGLNLRELAAV